MNSQTPCLPIESNPNPNNQRVKKRGRGQQRNKMFQHNPVRFNESPLFYMFTCASFLSYIHVRHIV